MVCLQLFNKTCCPHTDVVYSKYMYVYADCQCAHNLPDKYHKTAKLTMPGIDQNMIMKRLCITKTEAQLFSQMTGILFCKDCCGVSYYTDWSNASLVGVKSPNGSYPNSCYPGQDPANNIKKVCYTFLIGKLKLVSHHLEDSDS